MTVARPPKPAPSRASGLAVVVFLILICSPCLGLAGAFVYQYSDGQGRLTRWRPLGAPPETAVGFVAADPQIVYVATEGGVVYACEPHDAPSSGACWQPAAEPYRIDEDADFEHSVYSGQAPSPPGDTQDVVYVSIFYADAAFEARYALLTDGTVWIWEYGSSAGLALLALLAGPVIGLVLGIVVIVGLLLLFYARSRRAAAG